MLTRRGFAACALCAVGGLMATGAGAQSAASGFKRTIIKQTDGPMEGYVTLNVRVEAEPGAPIPRHTHPGIESSYIVEGTLELSIDGEATRTLHPGDGFQVPPRVPHSGKTGDSKAVIAATYVVEKDKPLASPA